MSEKVEGRSAIKKRIRSINRLLAKDDLPETVRITKQAVLKALHQQLNARQKCEKQRKLDKKYKMVKFFDKRKVSRKLKSTQREIDSCGDEEQRRELLQQAKHLKDELNYVVHYPKDEKYISLYPSTETASVQALKRREELLTEISKQVETGELPDISYACSWYRVSAAKGLELTDSHQNAVLRCQSEQNKHCKMPVSGKDKRKQSESILAAVDEDPVSVSVIYERTKQKLKEDAFFV